ERAVADRGEQVGGGLGEPTGRPCFYHGSLPGGKAPTMRRNSACQYHELGDDRPVVAALAEALPDRSHANVRRDQDMVQAQQGWQRPSVPRPGCRPSPPTPLVGIPHALPEE